VVRDSTFGRVRTNERNYLERSVMDGFRCQKTSLQRRSHQLRARAIHWTLDRNKEQEAFIIAAS
jgi:hypothetical protein